MFSRISVNISIEKKSGALLPHYYPFRNKYLQKQNIMTELQKPLYTLSVGEYISLNEKIFSEMLKKIPSSPPPPAPTDLLNIRQAAELLGYQVSSIYGLVNKNVIPFFKKPGTAKLFFSRSELLEWLREGRKPTQTEIENKATDYLVKR